MADKIQPEDQDALDQLRRTPGWTTAIDRRLVAAAKRGRLVALTDAVRGESFERAVSSALSSNAIAPVSAHSHLPNWPATFWALLDEKLTREGF